MSRCPFAVWMPIVRSPGRYLGGPWHIVHHMTEGSTAEGAFAAYRERGIAPTVTIDHQTIYQHFDTEMSASALLNLAGGVQTNRLSCVQIETVGFTNRRKLEPTLQNVAKFCRWVEKEHDIPPIWPNGYPRYGTIGDPGGHNRSIRNWVSEAGHYGHSQVPENTHYDPGYFPAEIEIVMSGVPLQEEPFKLFIDGRNMTGPAGATLENGTSRINCAVKDLCQAMNWPVKYYPEQNWTSFLTTPGAEFPEED